MPGSAAGAPLRAMASVAALWIVVRVISWHSPAHIAWHPGEPTKGRPLHHAAKPIANRRAGLPLTAAGRRAFHPITIHNNRSMNRTAFVTPIYPLPEQSSENGSRVPRPPWPYADEPRGFFLQAPLRQPGRGAGEGATTISRFPNPPASPGSKNWAAYFWIHARQDSGPERRFRDKQGFSVANGQYGGSQAGAILTWHLLDKPVPEVSVYGRLSAALAPVSQGEFAMGTRIRPFSNVPLAMHAEQRFDATSGGVTGTAFFATGGTGPDVVVERLALETYAQAGYVLGRNETYFFDGSATVQRPIADFAGQRLSLGAGLWTGGQRGIRRLDVGPRASLDLPLGGLSTRVAIDGRIRVAGNARPGSGAALTVSASF